MRMRCDAPSWAGDWYATGGGEASVPPAEQKGHPGVALVAQGIRLIAARAVTIEGTAKAVAKAKNGQATTSATTKQGEGRRGGSPIGHRNGRSTSMVAGLGRTAGALRMRRPAAFLEASGRRSTRGGAGYGPRCADVCRRPQHGRRWRHGRRRRRGGRRRCVSRGVVGDREDVWKEMRPSARRSSTSVWRVVVRS